MKRKKICVYCSDVKEKLYLCGRCLRTYYCSREHQKSDWKKHKSNCIEINQKKGYEKLKFTSTWKEKLIKKEDIIQNHWKTPPEIITMISSYCNFSFDLLRQIKITSNITCGVLLSQLPNVKFVSGNSNKTLKIWNVDTGECLKILKGHIGGVECVARISDSSIVSGSRDKTLRIWNIESGKCVKILRGHKEPVCRVVVLSNDLIMSGSYDFTLRVWRNDTNIVLYSHIGEFSKIGFVYCLIALPGDRFISCNFDKTLKIRNTNSGKCLQTLSGHTRTVFCVAIMPDGRIVSGSGDKTLRIWNPDSGKCLKVLKGHFGTVTCVAVMSNGNVVSGSYDDSLRIWNTDSGKCIQVLSDVLNTVNDEELPKEYLTCVTVLSDNRIIAAGGNRTLNIWG